MNGTAQPFDSGGWSASFPAKAAEVQVPLSSRTPLSTIDRLAAQIDPRNSWTGYLIAAGTLLSIGLALSEPSASEGLGLPARLAFWLAHVASAMFLFELAQVQLGRIALFDRLPPILKVVTVGMMGAFLFAAFNLLLLDRMVFFIDGLTDFEPISLTGLTIELRDSGAISVLFWFLLNSPRLIMIAQQHDTIGANQMSNPDHTQTVPEQAALPAAAEGHLIELLSRLPRRIGSDIVTVSAELHYLRVYTRSGEALILMSFGRAVEALGVIPGLRVHRSHWVALAHVLSLEIDGDRVLCRLDTGLEVPVSRTYRTSLRTALALRDEQRVLHTARKISEASGHGSNSG